MHVPLNQGGKKAKPRAKIVKNPTKASNSSSRLNILVDSLAEFGDTI